VRTRKGTNIESRMRHANPKSRAEDFCLKNWAVSKGEELDTAFTLQRGRKFLDFEARQDNYVLRFLGLI
jgi:hypothetical protein